jgi:cell division septation protein DedD
MIPEERRAPRSTGPGWLATAGGALLLIALGFGVGIVAGTAYQEPELVVDHLAGRTTEVVLDGETELAGGPDVAAPAPEGAEPPPAALGSGGLDEVPAVELPGTAPEAEVEAEEAASGGVTAAAPKAPARRAARAAPANGESFSIQVGAFSSEKAARQLASELGKRGFTAYLIDDGKGARFKVRVGPLESRNEAEAVSMRLKTEEQLPTWIQANG